MLRSHLTLRQAVAADVPVLRILIDASVRGLQAQDYTPTQIESALQTVYGVDSQLIADGTYFVVEADSDETKTAQPARMIVACGGWSKRKTLFGGDRWADREDALLDPRQDAAKIRAFFVHPKWVRRGIGSMILDACERAAAAVGFRRFGSDADRSTALPRPRIRRLGTYRSSAEWWRIYRCCSHGKTILRRPVCLSTF
jgi:GNAT superfamily N-acetyltransferase